MKKALVTGANGFVGSALTKELISNGVEVIALDCEGHCENIPDEAEFVSLDISESVKLPEIIADRDIEVFYHLAWAGVSGDLRSKTDSQIKNISWTIDCMHSAKKLGCKKFVGAGSIMEQETLLSVSKQGNRPGTGYVYGSAKAAAHSMCACVAADIGIDLVWTILTNAYGVGEISPRFINTTIRKIINNEELHFTMGTQNYDFVYIDDVARAFRLIGQYGKAFCHYLIGSASAKPLREFILEMKSTLAPDKDFAFGVVPFTGVSVPLEYFDCSLTEIDTGFKAEISFAEGIRRTMEWLKNVRE